ncbi:hypothetical protein F2Q69_00002962 [Brassica cretica]|uniref:O-fucosyltransferase family protein n=1 Tax=Brassica cretica TaxID=69181 RepID=A0A8S9NS94_BRACR|nr:hypothetical protein F2Q69_00002962 [Brassica cretica]
MQKPCLLSCFLFFIFFLIPQLSFSCPPDQRQSLLEFKNLLTQTIKNHSTTAITLEGLKTWRPNSDCCKWQLVRCNTRSLQVIELNLNSLVPSGSVSSSLLRPVMRITSLSTLDVSSNFIQGEIPGDGFANLTSNKFKSFSYLYDEEQFISFLKNDVIIAKALPESLKAARKRNDFPLFKPKNSASPNYYLEDVLPKLKKANVIGLIIYDGGCLQSNLPASMLELQRLRCRVAFHALQLRSEIQVLGKKMVDRLRKSGQPFLAYHPGLVKDKLAYHGCAELFQGRRLMSSHARREADVFFPGFNNDGSGLPDFSSLVMGQRLYEKPSSRTYRLDRKVFQEFFNITREDMYHPNRNWTVHVRKHLNLSLGESGLIRQSMLSKPRLFLSHPLPECSCRTSPLEDSRRIRSDDGRFLYGGEDECPKWIKSAGVEKSKTDDSDQPDYEHDLLTEQSETEEEFAKSKVASAFDQDEEWDPND